MGNLATLEERIKTAEMMVRTRKFMSDEYARAAYNIERGLRQMKEELERERRIK